MTAGNVGDELKRGLRWLQAATVVLYVAVGLAVFLVWRDSASTNKALCVFRSDLQVRASAGREFLRDHPKGTDGIPASAIRVSLAGQERTIKALSGLGCG